MDRAVVVFDIDDTLLHTYSVGFKKVQLTALALGLEPPTETEFRSVFGRLTFEECIRRWHPEISTSRYSSVYDEQRRHVPYAPVDHARETIDELLAQGVGVGILTNGSGFKTTLKLDALGVSADRFDFVCHGDNWQPPKPHVGAFRRLVSEFGLAAEHSMYVADNPLECAAAATAGICAVGVLTGSWTAEAFAAVGLEPPRVLPTVGVLLSADVLESTAL